MICQVYLDEWQCWSDSTGLFVCVCMHLWVYIVCVCSLCRWCSTQATLSVLSTTELDMNSYCFNMIWPWFHSLPHCVYMLYVSVRYRQLGLDLVPRREFSMVDPDEISVTELYRLVSGLTIPHMIFICSLWRSRVVKCGWLQDPISTLHNLSLFCPYCSFLHFS